MDHPHRQSPGICIDCGRPISDWEVRCRFCASRARVGLPRVQVAESQPQQLAELVPEVVARLGAQGHRYNAARLAMRFNALVERIRAIMEWAGDR